MRVSVRTIFLALFTGLALISPAQVQPFAKEVPSSVQSSNQPMMAAAHGEPLPDEVLAQLRSQMPAPGAKLSDVASTRRFRAVLSGGQNAVQTYPHASNLYLVRNLMLEAMQRLVELQTDDVRAEDALALAKEIVASDAPPAWKLNADVLLTDIAVSKAAEKPSKERPSPATQILKDFLVRYRQAPETYPQAAMQSITIARQNKQDGFAGEVARALANDYLDDPNVRAFLRQELGRRWNAGESLVGDVPLLDGKILHLPQDVFGKYVLLHIWNPEIPRCVAELKALKDFRQKYKSKPLEIVSVCTSTSRAVLEQVVQEQGLDWPQVFSGKGAEDPLVRMWGAQALPSYAIIGTDGRLRDGGGTERMQMLMDFAWRKQARLDILRSGVFMLSALVEQVSPALLESSSMPTNGPSPTNVTSAVVTTNATVSVSSAEARNNALPVVTHLPLETWTALANQTRDAVIAFPMDVKIRALQELRVLCAAAETAYPLAEENGVVRALHLAALEGLAFNREDESLAREGVMLARTIVDANPKLSRRVLADYVLARQASVHTERNRQQTTEQVIAFLAPYLKTDSEWLALPLAMSLACELGHWQLADEYCHRMGDPTSNNSHPEIRALLRTVFGLDLDQGAELHGQFTRLDGTPLNVPEDLTGRVAVIHFWTATAEPGVQWWSIPTRKHLDIVNPSDVLTSTTDRVIVAINLDRTREAAEAMAQKHPDWIVAQAGADNSIVRRYDMYPFPATWVLTKSGRGFVSDESVDLGAVRGRTWARLRDVLRATFRKPAEWQQVSNWACNAKDFYENTMILTTNGWRVSAAEMEQFEKATENVAREGLRGWGALAQENRTNLLAQLRKITPVAGGGWGPTNIVSAANDDIAVILAAKQGMEKGLELRQGMQWARSPDIEALLRMAAQTDCLCVPATPDGNQDRKLLAKFFAEVPALPLGTNAPSARTPAGTPQRFFRLKRLE